LASQPSGVRARDKIEEINIYARQTPGARADPSDYQPGGLCVAWLSFRAAKAARQHERALGSSPAGR